jgi:hypothetical protein
MFLGYEPGIKAYRLYDPAKRVVVSRDVVFDEGTAWDWSSGVESAVTSEFIVEQWEYGGAAPEPGVDATPTATNEGNAAEASAEAGEPAKK